MENIPGKITTQLACNSRGVIAFTWHFDILLSLPLPLCRTVVGSAKWEVPCDFLVLFLHTSKHKHEFWGVCLCRPCTTGIHIFKILVPERLHSVMVVTSHTHHFLCGSVCNGVNKE